MYLDVVDGGDCEVVRVGAGDEDDLLAVGVGVDLVDGGDEEAVLVVGRVGPEGGELDDDGVIVLEVVLRQELGVVGFNFRLDQALLLQDPHSQLAHRYRARPLRVALTDLELHRRLLPAAEDCEEQGQD